MVSTFRLLPGDQAPDLKLSRGLTDDPLHPVVFDRVSLVVLWNAGCRYCLPIIGELAEWGAEHAVPCYAVAVMVRDVETTAVAAKSISSKAIFVLEEPSHTPSAISRGWVTRHWLEASGQLGVPAGFIVDQTNTVVWIGHPSEAKQVLLDLLRGEWDINIARRDWSARVSEDSVRKIEIDRDILEALVAGEYSTAIALIEQAEAKLPSIIADREFNILKLNAVTGDSNQHDLANRFYAQSADRFPSDIDLQLRLASCMTVRMPGNKAGLEIVINRLKHIEQTWNSSPEADHPEILFQLRLHLTLAEAAKLTGSPSDAERHIARASLLADSPHLEEAVRQTVVSEIARVKA